MIDLIALQVIAKRLREMKILADERPSGVVEASHELLEETFGRQYAGIKAPPREVLVLYNDSADCVQIWVDTLNNRVVVTDGFSVGYGGSGPVGLLEELGRFHAMHDPDLGDGALGRLMDAVTFRVPWLDPAVSYILLFDLEKATVNFWRISRHSNAGGIRLLKEALKR